MRMRISRSCWPKASAGRLSGRETRTEENSLVLQQYSGETVCALPICSFDRGRGMIEPLESRHLLSAPLVNATLTGGTLTVTGTAGNDKITLTEGSGEILVTIGKDSRPFTTHTVRRIVVD